MLPTNVMGFVRDVKGRHIMTIRELIADLIEYPDLDATAFVVLFDGTKDDMDNMQPLNVVVVEEGPKWDGDRTTAGIYAVNPNK